MRSFLLFLLALTSCIPAEAQWISQNSGTTTSLEDIYFVNTDTGFVVGSGIIRKTYDGGTTWQPAFTASAVFTSITFTNPQTGFATGLNINTNNTCVAKTTDWGATWTVTDLTPTEIPMDIFFATPLIGFIVGGNGMALRTIDGGLTWLELTTSTTVELSAVFFTDQFNGIIAGGGPGSAFMLQTVNGGTNWNIVTTPAGNFLQSVFFPSPLIGYAVGWSGEIIKTTDGGINWTTQTPASVYGNVDVFFTDDLTGYIVGGSSSFAGIMKTTNGGQTWVAQAAPVNQGLLAVYFATPLTGYACGAQGTIIKTTTGGVGFDELSNSLSVSIGPNPSTGTISIYSETGENIFLAIYDQNGSRVFERAEIRPAEIIDISRLAAGNYVVVAQSGEKRNVTKIVKL
jgi:photosystem II stability/assembly factor-like uncharacterized protein